MEKSFFRPVTVEDNSDKVISLIEKAEVITIGSDRIKLLLGFLLRIQPAEVGFFKISSNIFFHILISFCLNLFIDQAAV